ncbi:hypothetical protein TNCT_345471 [Trichonephila clavata]|uniref:Uncharacterized protein n=1 Tax=Trichonephila clavata TaxID=2740835 RepID=A0A8X6GYN8_TRICU|nr:hypothetical protein TNCT_345471 [Trichonephila clavata]
MRVSFIQATNSIKVKKIKSNITAIQKQKIRSTTFVRHRRLSIICSLAVANHFSCYYCICKNAIPLHLV